MVEGINEDTRRGRSFGPLSVSGELITAATVEDEDAELMSRLARTVVDEVESDAERSRWAFIGRHRRPARVVAADQPVNAGGHRDRQVEELPCCLSTELGGEFGSVEDTVIEAVIAEVVSPSRPFPSDTQCPMDSSESGLRYALRMAVYSGLAGFALYALGIW